MSLFARLILFCQGKLYLLLLFMSVYRVYIVYCVLFVICGCGCVFVLQQMIGISKRFETKSTLSVG